MINSRSLRTCVLLCLLLFSKHSFSDSKPPFVFAHGLGVPHEVYEHLLPMKRFFQNRGYEFLVAKTPMAGSLRARSKILYNEINRLVPKGKFHVIGHSMGGLDARAAVSHFSLGDRCLTLTTISTPHRGSPVADFIMQNLSSSYKTIKAIFEYLKLDIQAVHDLTTGYLENVFNKHVPDDPRVRYLSAAFYIPEPAHQHSFLPWLWFTHSIIVNSGDSLNDGLVSVSSARWGYFLGAFPGDHLTSTTAAPFNGGVSYETVLDQIIRSIENTPYL